MNVESKKDAKKQRDDRIEQEYYGMLDKYDINNISSSSLILFSTDCCRHTP